MFSVLTFGYRWLGSETEGPVNEFVARSITVIFPKDKELVTECEWGDPPEWSFRSVKLAVQMTSGPRARETRTGFVRPTEKEGRAAGADGTTKGPARACVGASGAAGALPRQFNGRSDPTHSDQAGQQLGTRQSRRLT